MKICDMKLVKKKKVLGPLTGVAALVLSLSLQLWAWFRGGSDCMVGGPKAEIKNFEDKGLFCRMYGVDVYHICLLYTSRCV